MYIELTALPLLHDPIKQARPYLIRPAHATTTWGLDPAPWVEQCVYAQSADTAIERAAIQFARMFYNTDIKLYYSTGNASMLLKTITSNNPSNNP